MKKSKNFLITPILISIGVLLWALIPTNPYGYYIFLRIVVCAVCIFLANYSLKNEYNNWIWVFGVIAIIYNPIIRVHLNRSLWSIINIITIIILIISFFSLLSLSSFLKSSSGSTAPSGIDFSY